MYVQRPTEAVEWLYRVRRRALGPEFSGLPGSLRDLDPATAWGLAWLVAVITGR